MASRLGRMVRGAIKGAKEANRLAFADIPDSVWFFNSLGRRMIRMRRRSNAQGELCVFSFDKLNPFNKKVDKIKFNAVDDRGVPCCCPDDAVFELEK